MGKIGAWKKISDIRSLGNLPYLILAWRTPSDKLLGIEVSPGEKGVYFVVSDSNIGGVHLNKPMMTKKAAMSEVIKIMRLHPNG